MSNLPLSELNETILHLENDPIKLKNLIESRIYQNMNIVTKFGNTPLHYPKSPECVELLLRYGANPNLQNHYGNTALHKQKDPRSIKLLLQYGASKSIKNIHRKIPRDVNKNVPISKLYYLLVMFVVMILVFIGMLCIIPGVSMENFEIYQNKNISYDRNNYKSFMLTQKHGFYEFNRID